MPWCSEWKRWGARTDKWGFASMVFGETTKTLQDTEPVTTSNKTWTYDQGDRMQTGANNSGTYKYDPLGRQTKLIPHKELLRAT